MVLKIEQVRDRNLYFEPRFLKTLLCRRDCPPPRKHG